MGIIMERLNNSIPQLQNAIATGFENVSAGIVENAKSSGIAGLESTFEIFSDSSLVSADANLISTVSEASAYPGPIESLAKDSPILQTLKEQGFKPEREIASIFKPGWDKGSGWLNQLSYGLKMDQSIADQSIDGKLADGAARKQAKASVSEFTPDPPSALTNILGPGGDKGSDWLNQLSYGLKMDQSIADQSIDGKLADGAARKQAKGPVSDVVPDPPVAVPPSVIPPPQQTYFQTIDQTAEQMQMNPQPETAQLFQQQFSAVQEMTSAVKETLQLYKQLNSNSVFSIK